MSKLSILIPARSEPYLQKTIDDLLAKAAGEVEIIVTLDGYRPDPALRPHDRLKLVYKPQPEGMRAAINGTANAATGEFIMKCDAHCMFSPGYDEILKANCADDWIVVPRRYSLDAEKWAVKPDKPAIDYHYLSYPYGPDGGLHGRPWKDRAKARATVYPIDDEMSSQGSCWFMTREHWKRIGGMPETGYGTFSSEFQQLGLMTWLGGGRVVVNKSVWYAHLHKSGGRGYYLSKHEADAGAKYCTDFWMNNRWPERKYDIQWLIDKFAPVPGWPNGHA